MKSPFPGVDPYIEACDLWGDFHNDLIAEIKRFLAPAVRGRYFVRTGERSYLVLVESQGKESYPFVPDVKVSTRPRPKKATKKGTTAVAETDEEGEPVVLRAFVAEEHRETFVEIYESKPEQRLVTTIEVLSPSNKRPQTEGWEQYQRKRQSLLLGNVNLVEIDLLRGGQRPPMLDPWPTSPYTLLVARAHSYQRCKVWPGHWRRPLPTIPVPLAKPDADVLLQLQPMIDAIYERSGYEDSIDYTKPLRPRLPSEDDAWLKQQLRARSQRS